MPKTAAKCKHPHLDVDLFCTGCGDKVDIREKRNKYGNRKAFLDGMWFDSVKESRRWTALSNDPDVRSLQRQVTYLLQVNGVNVSTYRADFVYIRVISKDGWIEVVEDAKPRGKGFKKTEVYRTFVIKKNLMKAIHGIDVVEV
jgi:hypothetical protein